MKVPKKVKAPYGCASYLTAGKEYKVLITYKHKLKGLSIKIIDDEDRLLYPPLVNAQCLNGQDWIVTEWEEQ